MSVIERINNELVKLAIPRQLIPPDPVNYIPWTALTVFLSSLASERCVWNVEKTDDVEFLRPSCRESQCYVEFRSKAEWFKGCPFCLKQIEVKEADNGR